MSNDDRNILDSGFKLSPLIKQVLAESQATETDDLAGEVFDRIARHDRDMALFQALRSLVRESWRPAFIPSQQTVRTEQRSQAEQTVSPARDGRQWMTTDGRVADTPEEVAAARVRERTVSAEEVAARLRENPEFRAAEAEDAEADAIEQEAAQMVADEVAHGVPEQTAVRHAQETAQTTWRQRQEALTAGRAPLQPPGLTPIRPVSRPQPSSWRTTTPQPATPPSAPRESPKVAAIREAWRKALRQRIATGQGHKFLADCTVVDLEFAADQREQHAKRTQARADQLRSLAEVMRTHHAAKLADVPSEVLAVMSETLTEAAAA